MQRSIQQGGYSMVELVVVIAILAIVAAFSTYGLRDLYLSGMRKSADGEVRGALEAARTKTQAAQNDSVYGVRIASTSVTRFTGTSYVAGAASNTVYTFEGGVTATGTLVTGNANSVFKRMTGQPTASGTIYLRNSTGTSTIIIHPTGLIE